MIFDALRSHAGEIEAAPGWELSWEPWEDKRGCGDRSGVS